MSSQTLHFAAEQLAHRPLSQSRQRVEYGKVMKRIVSTFPCCSLAILNFRSDSHAEDHLHAGFDNAYNVHHFPRGERIQQPGKSGDSPGPPAAQGTKRQFFLRRGCWKDEEL